MMFSKKIITVLIALLSIPALLTAQVTTSSMSGFVKNPKGDALVGATVKATHEPTGTVYSVTTTRGGRFEISNMNPGGPYKVEVTFVGYEPLVKDDINLTLGETFNYNTQLSDKTGTLTEVTVTSAQRPVAKTGTETNIGRDKIANLPTVGRNLNDFVRFTPQAKINSNGGMSIAGQNVRFNNFTIDGAVNNDVFGLSDQGTNGGRAGVPPISMDAIDQITVQISPYDASIGNFTGGGINAITRSGTNKFEGSVYDYFRNENLTGKTPGNLPESLRLKQTSFTNQTIGFRIGGPIIKNKLFFFLNAEKQNDERPQPTTAPDILASGWNIKDSVAKLVNFLKTNYNYDPGDYINNPDIIKRDNVNARIDFNANKNNKFTLSYGYTKAERFNPSRSSSTSINFFNSAEYYPTTTHRGAFEWNTKLTNKVNNKFRVSATDIVDDRGITGNPFPGVTIFGSGAASPTINLGSQVSSTANLLKQRIVNIFDAFKFNVGKNNMTVGADVDLNKTYNLFINRAFGNYQFSNLQDFLNKARPTRYQRSYSLVDATGKVGDENINSAANFKTARLGFYFNDDIKVNPHFTLSVGVRADKTSFLDDTYVDNFFRDTAMPVISQYYDLEGASVGKLSSPSWQVSPRIGFRYSINDESLILRGGIGLFGGRTPLVWPGGLYQNNGVTIGAVDANGTTQIAAFNPGGTGLAAMAFNPNINTQYTQADFGLPASRNKPQGDMNLIAKDYKLPSVLKTSFGADKRLGKGWSFNMDLLFTKNVYEADWLNVNFLPASYQIASGPDKRSIYTFVNATTGATTYGSNTFLTYRPSGTALVDRNPYGNVILLRNSKGKKGFSYNFTFGVEKAANNGLSFGANYTYGSSMVHNEGTSSVNTSNWSFMESVAGRNNLGVTFSDFDPGHRVSTYLSKKFTYAKKHASTTVTFYYNGQSGNNFSYVYSGNFIGDGVTGNDLVYIPKDRAEMDQMTFLYNNLIPGYPTATTGTAMTAQNIIDQKDLYEKYILSDRYLRKNRGRYAERNGARLPFVNQLDFKAQQDFSLTVSGRKHILSLTWDVFNFSNLLSKNWGRQYFLTNDQFTLVSFGGYAAGGVPQYRFSPVTGGRPGNLSDGVTPFNNSRWTSQIGIRYSFY